MRSKKRHRRSRKKSLGVRKKIQGQLQDVSEPRKMEVEKKKALFLGLLAGPKKDRGRKKDLPRSKTNRAVWKKTFQGRNKKEQRFILLHVPISSQRQIRTRSRMNALGERRLASTAEKCHNNRYMWVTATSCEYCRLADLPSKVSLMMNI